MAAAEGLQLRHGCFDGIGVLGRDGDAFVGESASGPTLSPNRSEVGSLGHSAVTFSGVCASVVRAGAQGQGLQEDAGDLRWVVGQEGAAADADRDELDLAAGAGDPAQLGKCYSRVDQYSGGDGSRRTLRTAVYQ